MKRVLTLLSLLVSFALLAQERVPVWPKGKMPDAQGHQIAAMTDDIWSGSRNRPIQTAPA